MIGFSRLISRALPVRLSHPSLPLRFPTPFPRRFIASTPAPRMSIGEAKRFLGEAEAGTLKTTPETSAIYFQAIRAMINADALPLALRAFDTMLKLNVPVGRGNLSLLLFACARSKMGSLGDSVASYVQETHYRYTPRVLLPLVMYLCRNGREHEARMALVEAHAKSTVSNADLWNAYLEACPNLTVDAAREVFDQMRLLGVRPDIGTFDVLTRISTRARDFETTATWIQAAEDEHLQWSSNYVNTLLFHYAQDAVPEKFIQVLQRAIDEGLEVDPKVLVRACESVLIAAPERIVDLRKIYSRWVFDVKSPLRSTVQMSLLLCDNEQLARDLYNTVMENLTAPILPPLVILCLRFHWSADLLALLKKAASLNLQFYHSTWSPLVEFLVKTKPESSEELKRYEKILLKKQ